MTETVQTEVLIVGGGPAGLTLAMDLARRGVEVTVAERRRFAEAPADVKCNHISARSMETFRTLGVADTLRDTGLPPDYPNDAAYKTSVLGTELGRTRIPCRAERFTATGGRDTWWPTPEPAHRINQIYMEPVLAEHAATFPRLRMLNQTQVERFEETDDGVVATATSLATGEALEVRARYIVGCDGGRSAIRRQLGIALSGTPVIRPFQSTYIRAPELLSMISEPAWFFLTMSPGQFAMTLAIDGRETWLVHRQLNAPDAEFDSVDRDEGIRTILGVDEDFEYEVISKQDWVGRALVADRFRGGRAFLCGDAAHIWIPFGGYGMNAAIADAMNLSWLLAAHLRGWAPESILDAYEAERLPITSQVSQHALGHARSIIAQLEAVPANIEEPGPEGDELRREYGRAVEELNQEQFCAGGLNFGYYYDASPIVAYDGAEAPAYTMGDFEQSTVPGCRTPHVRLDDGRSLYDAMGMDYTLLRFDPALDVAPLLRAAEARKVPLELLDVVSSEAEGLYEHALVLSRPDRHVGWRGNAVPEDPAALIDLMRGAVANVPAATVRASG
jgi:2-polyprenyl-6-methoxyphenol hydroxylase-like FAD-dependent oxidoreductase